MSGKVLLVSIPLLLVLLALTGTSVFAYVQLQSAMERTKKVGSDVLQLQKDLLNLDTKWFRQINLAREIQNKDSRVLFLEVQAIRELVAQFQSPDYGPELAALNQSVRALNRPQSSASEPSSEAIPVWPWHLGLTEGREMFNQCVLNNISRSPEMDSVWIQDYLQSIENILDSSVETDEESTLFFLINLGAAHNCWKIELE